MSEELLKRIADIELRVARLECGPVRQLKPLEESDREIEERWRNMGRPRPNGIACPKCGVELMDSDPGLVMTSAPPQLNVHCPGCGFKGTRYV